MHARPLRYRPYAPYAHDVHARCDTTMFTCNASHVIMMCMNENEVASIIGVCISSTPCHHGSLHIGMMLVGMTSLCSHHICIALMTSSHLHHDIIATHVRHVCSHGA